MVGQQRINSTISTQSAYPAGGAAQLSQQRGGRVEPILKHGLNGCLAKNERPAPRRVDHLDYRQEALLNPSLPPVAHQARANITKCPWAGTRQRYEVAILLIDTDAVAGNHLLLYLSTARCILCRYVTTNIFNNP